MAQGATIYNFDIDLSDTDRHVYESPALRVARHPSESEEYLVARVLAYLLEFAEGSGAPRAAGRFRSVGHRPRAIPVGGCRQLHWQRRTPERTTDSIRWV
jgi:hypothetical protein